MINIYHNYNFNEIIRSEALNNNSKLINNRILHIKNNLEFKIFCKSYEAHNTLLTLIIVISDMDIEFIKNSLNAVTNQLYEKPEIIFINHGCKKEIKLMIDNYFKNYPYAQLVEIKNNKYPELDDEKNSLINLWNLGLFISKGEYVYQLSPDDIISKKYTFFITNHFKLNQKCISIIPRVLSIDDKNRINKIKSKSYKLDFYNYFSNYDLMDKVIFKKDILSPGGAVVTKTKILIKFGGFNLCSDFSQYFVNCCIGINGYCYAAKLIWRHHPNQTNKKETRQGLIRYKIYYEYFYKYNLFDIHKKFLNDEYARKFKKFYFGFIENKVIDDFRLIYRSGNTKITINAIEQIFNQSNKNLLMSCIKIVITDFMYHIYNKFLILRVMYRFMKSNIDFFSKKSRR